MWQHMERMIARLNRDRWSSLVAGIRGTFLLVGESFLKLFNLRGYKGVIAVEIKIDENASEASNQDPMDGV